MGDDGMQTADESDDGMQTDDESDDGMQTDESDDGMQTDDESDDGMQTDDESDDGMQNADESDDGMQTDDTDDGMQTADESGSRKLLQSLPTEAPTDTPTALKCTQRSDPNFNLYQKTAVPDVPHACFWKAGLVQQAERAGYQCYTKMSGDASLNGDCCAECAMF